MVVKFTTQPAAEGAYFGSNSIIICQLFGWLYHYRTIQSHI